MTKRETLIEDLRCLADLWIVGGCPSGLDWCEAYIEVDKYLSGSGLTMTIGASGSIAYAALEVAARLEAKR